MTLLMPPRLQTAMPRPSNTRLLCAAREAGHLGLPPDHTADRLKIALENLQQARHTRAPLVIPICKTFPVCLCACANMPPTGATYPTRSHVCCSL